MTAAVTRTEAETELARQFATLAPMLPGAAWVPAARARAMQAFEAAGLPHRRIEEWKYTDLRNGLKSAFAPATCSSLKVDTALMIRALGAEMAELRAVRFVLVNGRYVARLLPDGMELPAGVHAGSLAGAIGQPGYEWMQPFFEPDRSAESGEDPMLALNSAFVSDGLVLRVDGGTSVGLPIHIVSIVDADAPKAVAIRNLVKIGEGAEATLVESHVVLGDAPTQTTAVTQLTVEARACLRHIKHVAGLDRALHVGRWDAAIAEAATYRGFQLTAGAGLLRNESRLTFEGADAKVDLSGLMLGRAGDHIDTTLVVDHRNPGCESRELFKAVLDGHARAVFQGKVVVAPEAQKTDGKQMAQALMLSEDAEFDSKPELEIYADDVVCGHGSTSAELDPDMLFYLRSRGIPEPEACTMLIESFVSEALDKIDDEPLRHALRNVAHQWLAGR